jgi:hypothetical protein
MTGNRKHKITVIGKAKNPRCFGKRKLTSLPCDYTNTGKGWMNASLFATLLIEFNLRMKILKRKVVLLVDGAGLYNFFSMAITSSNTSFCFIQDRTSLTPL